MAADAPPTSAFASAWLYALMSSPLFPASILPLPVTLTMLLVSLFANALAAPMEIPAR